MDRDRLLAGVHAGETRAVARAISLVEDGAAEGAGLLAGLDRERIEHALVVGITGPPGAGKSTLTGALAARFRRDGERVGIVAVDPSSPLTGGAILGDRIRMMAHALDAGVLLRSMASRGQVGGLCGAAGGAVRIMAAAGCGVVLLESVGIGQTEMGVTAMADLSVLVLAPGFGDDIQAMKAGILEVVDLIVVNKADLAGADRLLLDLGGLFADPDQRERRLCATRATDGDGVDALAERIRTLARSMREDGRLRRRRRDALARETLDRAVEMVRKHLARKLITNPPVTDEPALAAVELLAGEGIETTP